MDSYSGFVATTKKTQVQQNKQSHQEMSNKNEWAFFKPLNTGGQQAHEKMHRIISYQGNANKTQVRMGVIQDFKNNKYLQGCGGKKYSNPLLMGT